jgi:DNA polymerase III alpha subunit (gram-positive type)
MKITILDSEYLSLSKRNSDLKSLIKFKKKLFPEIIQISFLKCSNIYLENNQKRLNILIKIKQKLPIRIEKLTKITSNILKKQGSSFKESMSLIDRFIDDKSILIANGEDLRLLKLNIKYNNLNKRKKKLVYYVNLKKILNRIYKKQNHDTENLNKVFKFKIEFNPHNSSNDCIILYRTIKKLINIFGKEKFKDIISKNKQVFTF